MTEILVAILGAVALLALTALWDRASKAGQVSTALETVGLLQSQVNAYKEDNSALRMRVDQLESALSALKDLVTSASAVAEVKMLLQSHDRQVSEALGRIEHSLSNK